MYHLPPNHRHVPLGELAISRLEMRGYVFHELTHEYLIRRQRKRLTKATAKFRLAIGRHTPQSNPLCCCGQSSAQRVSHPEKSKGCFFLCIDSSSIHLLTFCNLGNHKNEDNARNGNEQVDKTRSIRLRTMCSGARLKNRSTGFFSLAC